MRARLCGSLTSGEILTTACLFLMCCAKADPTPEQRKKLRAEAAERISTKIQALFWVAVGGAVTYQTDLPKVLVRPNTTTAPASHSTALTPFACLSSRLDTPRSSPDATSPRCG